MQLVSVNGGEKDNAIAKFSEASVAVLPEELEAAKQIVEDTFAQIKEEYKVTDPDAKLTVNVKEAAKYRNIHRRYNICSSNSNGSYAKWCSENESRD